MPWVPGRTGRSELANDRVLDVGLGLPGCSFTLVASCRCCIRPGQSSAASGVVEPVGAARSVLRQICFPISSVVSENDKADVSSSPIFLENGRCRREPGGRSICRPTTRQLAAHTGGTRSAACSNESNHALQIYHCPHTVPDIRGVRRASFQRICDVRDERVVAFVILVCGGGEIWCPGQGVRVN